MEQQLTLRAETAERLDRFLAQHIPGLSRSYAQQLITGGLVTVNGKARKPSWKVSPGDAIGVTLPAPRPPDVVPEAMALDILYEDADVLVVNKPAGMPVHPAPGHERGTLVNALLAYSPDLAGIGGVLRPGIVHRLDKDTSGVLVVAKNQQAHQSLSRQIKDRQVLKLYLALVHGEVEPPQGLVDAPIARDPQHRKRMAVVSGGRPAQTAYRVLATVPGMSLVKARLYTGRTHQVRVHFAALGHPVVGDPVYGRPADRIGRQCLHAWRLGFVLPRDGTWREFTAPLPSDLRSALLTAGFARDLVDSLDAGPVCRAGGRCDTLDTRPHRLGD